MTKDTFKIYSFCTTKIDELHKEIEKTKDFDNIIILMAKISSLWDVALKCYEIKEDSEC